ncbi:unnamed protein product, partial [Lymnaea stagnalis]
HFFISSIFTLADIGKIYIGVQNTSTGLPIVEDYIFTEADTNKTIPVYALVFSGANPTIRVPKNEDIIIYCTVSETGVGFSEITVINNVALPATINSTTISLNLNKAGRPVQIACFGSSPSSVCPAVVGGAQFCNETSRSNSVSVAVQPRGTISLCDTFYSVKNNPGATGTTPYQFGVRLSQVPDSDVTASCSANPAILNISSADIPSGTISKQIPYGTISVNTGESATVTCTAQSKTGNQFETATLTSGSAQFILRGNSVSLKPERSRIYNTTVTSIFSLSEAIASGSATAQVSCLAYLVYSISEAEAAIANPVCEGSSTTTSTTTTTTSTTTTTTTTTPVTSNGSTTAAPTTAAPPATPAPTPQADPNSEWTVINPRFDIPSSPSQGIYSTVTTQRVKIPIDVRTEIVVTVCCVPQSSSNSQFRDKRAASYAVASLAPYVCQGCANNQTVLNPTEERVLQNPGYVAVAPCACDLTRYACDINCCCDTECSTREKARFSGCIAGLSGGQSPEDQDYKCSSKAFNPTDWHLVTCVYWENNGYLGMYYQSRSKLKSSDEFSQEVAQKSKGRFTFGETERRFDSSTTSGYSYGSVIRSIREDVTTNNRFLSGTLALSQPGPGGLCNQLTPVQYLVDFTSSCRVTVTPQLCNPLSVLSSRIYIVSSTIAGCSQSFKVAQTLEGKAAAVADVRYYCATNLSSYLPSGQSQPSAGTESNFPSTLANVNCTDGCSDRACWEYNTNKMYGTAPTLPPRCTWDDGYTIRTSGMEANDITCFNAVLEVRYNFEWDGSEITQVTADIIMANVTAGVDLMQKFAVTWQARTNSTVRKSDNYDNSAAPYRRSGTAGYDMGKALSSGCSGLNRTSGQFNSVDAINEKQMSVFRPGADGLCVNAARKPVTFGDDVMSGCALILNFATLNNSCTELRHLVTNHLNVLMSSDVIGRYGYNDPSDVNKWVPVLRQSLNKQNDQSTSTPTPTTTLNTTANATQVNQTEPLWSWADTIAGICLLPTGIHFNVMYAQTGAVNGYPRYEVVGAYISYTQSNWTMDCAGANRQRCDGSSTQKFLLTSSIQFIR